jgi:hypothetical protein
LIEEILLNVTSRDASSTIKESCHQAEPEDHSICTTVTMCRLLMLLLLLLLLLLLH